MGLDGGYGTLNAITSEIKINQKYLKEVFTKKPISLEELFKEAEYELIDETILDPIIQNKEEANKIIKYKIPLLLNKENVLITDARLVYFPFWKTTIADEKRTYSIDINALDKKDIKNIESILEKFMPKEDKSTEENVFFEALNEFFSLEGFFKMIVNVLISAYRAIIIIFKKIYEYNAIVYYILLIIIFVLLYLLIK